MKDILTEMNNKLQGINNRVEKAENQISDLDYKEAKTPDQNSKSNKKKNEDLRSSGATSSTPTVASWGGQEKRARNLFEK